MTLGSKADSIVLRTDEYETRTCNAWRSDDSEPVYSGKSEEMFNLSGFDFYEDYSNEERVSIFVLINLVGLPAKVHVISLRSYRQPGGSLQRE
jgi:hypothetical protein